jgi:hypothetical protein
MKLFVQALTAAMLLSTAAVAAPDLVGRIGSDVEILSEGKIRFTVTVENIGDAPITGVNRIKSFLIPVADLNSEPTLNGVVLPNSDQDISLAAGQSIVQVVEVDLPRVPMGEWLVGAVVNSNSAIVESSIANNHTPDLVAAGSIVNDIPVPAVGGTDFYQEIDGGIQFWGGSSISHLSRTILRGEQNGVTPEQVWARFMIADVANRKLWTTPYGSEVEKQWGSLAWQNEFDVNANPIVIDYYGNSNDITGIPPGEYQFLTLLNSRDLFEEIDTSNNLDLAPLSLPTLRIIDSVQAPVEAVFVSMEQGQAVLTWSATLSRPWSETASVFASSPADAPWLSVVNSNITVNESGQMILSFDASGLQPGSYQTTMTLLVTDSSGESRTVNLPVDLTVRSAEFSPQLGETSALNFVTIQEHAPESQILTLTNSGSAPLRVHLQAFNPWIKTSVKTAVIEAGASLDVEVSVAPYAMRAPSTYSGIIRVSSSDAVVTRDVTVNLTINRPETN